MIRVNMKELTFDDLADVGQLIYDELGLTLEELQHSPKQALAAPAFATVWQRRTNPDFTFADARKLPVGEIQVIDDAETPGGSNGAAPALSPASGS